LGLEKCQSKYFISPFSYYIKLIQSFRKISVDASKDPILDLFPRRYKKGKFLEFTYDYPSYEWERKLEDS